MRPPAAVLVGLVMFLGAGTASAQSIAELLPAKTLGYVELQQPAAFAKEVGALLEGSYLSDVPDSLAPLYAKARGPRPYGEDMLAIAGVALAPEMLREFGRIKGAAVAVTGIDKEERGMPEFLVIVQPGESNLPGLMMRMFMASYQSSYGTDDGKGRRLEVRRAFERVGEFLGVGLYREVERRFEGDAEPKVRMRGPALARLPDALLMGSPDLVKQAIRRAKKQSQTTSLAGVAAFQKAQRDAAAAPGLFAFANPSAVMDMLEQFPLPEWMGVAMRVVNPNAFTAVADQLTLENGTLHYRRRVYLDAKEKSPIVELLPKGPVPRGLLHFAPPDAVLFAAVANDDGETRWQRLVELADNLFKGGGDRDLPSRHVAELERGLGVSIGKDVIGKIRGVGFAMPGVQELMKDLTKPDPRPDGPPMALLVDAIDEAAATRLGEDIVPKLFAMMSRGREVADSERTVGGHKLRALHTKNTRYTLHYGREGSTLVLGPDATFVAAALTHGQKKQGLPANDKTAKRLDAVKEPAAVGLMRPMTLGAGAFVYLMSSFGPGDAKAHVPKEALQLLEVVKAEEPLLLTITRTPEQIALEATYPGLRPLLARVTNFILEENLRARTDARRRAEEAKEAK